MCNNINRQDIFISQWLFYNRWNKKREKVSNLVYYPVRIFAFCILTKRWIMKNVRVWAHLLNAFEGSLLSAEGNKQIVNLTIEWERNETRCRKLQYELILDTLQLNSVCLLGFE